MRTFIINQLTQTSTWFGIIIILCAVFLPHSWIFGVGLFIMVTDDTRLKTFFDAIRAQLEVWWTA